MTEHSKGARDAAEIEQLREREPHYRTIGQKLSDPRIPKNIKDLVRERHIAERQEIGLVTGSLELAYLRGVQAGFEDSHAPAMIGLLEQCHSMFDDHPDFEINIVSEEIDNAFHTLKEKIKQLLKEVKK